MQHGVGVSGAQAGAPSEAVFSQYQAQQVQQQAQQAWQHGAVMPPPRGLVDAYASFEAQRAALMQQQQQQVATHCAGRPHAHAQFRAGIIPGPDGVGAGTVPPPPPGPAATQQQQRVRGAGGGPLRALGLEDKSSGNAQAAAQQPGRPGLPVVGFGYASGHPAFTPQAGQGPRGGGSDMGAMPPPQTGAGGQFVNAAVQGQQRPLGTTMAMQPVQAGPTVGPTANNTAVGAAGGPVGPVQGSSGVMVQPQAQAQAHAAMSAGPPPSTAPPAAAGGTSATAAPSAGPAGTSAPPAPVTAPVAATSTTSTSGTQSRGAAPQSSSGAGVGPTSTQPSTHGAPTGASGGVSASAVQPPLPPAAQGATTTPFSAQLPAAYTAVRAVAGGGPPTTAASAPAVPARGSRGGAK